MTATRHSDLPTFLGASLYVPANHARLESVLDELVRGKGRGLSRSVIVCLEDAVREDDLEHSVRAASQALRTLSARRDDGDDTASVRIYVRPRTPELLSRLLHDDAFHTVHGFVFPKVDIGNVDAWLRAASAHPRASLMPTLETRDAFEPARMAALRDHLLPARRHILALRVGGNDLLSLLHVRRPRERTAWDTVLAPVLSQLLTTFVPWGFSLTAPVFEHASDLVTLQEEVARDVEAGFIGKTAIHPRQVPVIDAAFAVTAADLADANAILDPASRAVFGSNGSMCEPATHAAWARNILARAERFGLRGERAPILTAVG